MGLKFVILLLSRFITAILGWSGKIPIYIVSDYKCNLMSD